MQLNAAHQWPVPGAITAGVGVGGVGGDGGDGRGGGGTGKAGWAGVLSGRLPAGASGAQEHPQAQLTPFDSSSACASSSQPRQTSATVQYSACVANEARIDTPGKGVSCVTDGGRSPVR
jgi:hypothetical protein